MKPSDALEQNREAIRLVVARNRAYNPRVFGSVARLQDTQSSDLDLLVDPSPEMSLFNVGAIKHELQTLLGFKVDVLTPGALPDSFKERVLREAIRI